MGKLLDLIHDDRNINIGTSFGEELLEKSFDKFGAGRSVLVDRNNNIIAGNKSVEAAIKKGIEESIIVETDGSKLVVVKRKDIDLDSKHGREMALADNATTLADIDFDKSQLESIEQDYCIDSSEWDIIKDTLNEEDFNLDKKNTPALTASTFNISIVFTIDKKELISSYVRENGKELLTQKVLELCQLQEAK